MRQCKLKLSKVFIHSIMVRFWQAVVQKVQRNNTLLYNFRSIICHVVAYSKLTLGSKRGRGSLRVREVVAYKRFQI